MKVGVKIKSLTTNKSFFQYLGRSTYLDRYQCDRVPNSRCSTTQCPEKGCLQFYHILSSLYC